MFRALLLAAFLALCQSGCVFEYEDRYRVAKLPDDARKRFERKKRDLLEIKDLKVGSGPIAAWNRRISADIEVRYLDGTLVYRGPVFTIMGFYGIPDAGVSEEGHLAGAQEGIRLGLNGMAVGGKRRIIVDRSLVCTNLKMDANLPAGCLLVGTGLGTRVRKEKLIVEATLTESCIPVKLMANIWYIGVNTYIRCREVDTPSLDPTAPIWRFY